MRMEMRGVGVERRKAQKKRGKEGVEVGRNEGERERSEKGGTGDGGRGGCRVARRGDSHA